MKWLISIFLILSIACNVYFMIDEMRFHRIKEMEKAMNKAMGGEFSKTTWKEGLEIFTNKLKYKHGDLLNKKYYYINIWPNWCIPCVNEMPWLDSIAGNLKKDVGYIFLSDISDSVANNCIRKNNYNLKNFVFLNDMNDFVSAICNEKGTKSKAYPMVLILSNKGLLLHYSIGAYGSAREASDFAEMINRLE